jgi:hypothetical protein
MLVERNQFLGKAAALRIVLPGDEFIVLADGS